ncbi:hypothetical protein AB0J80_06170 [Actinoplanes sp. NPDC049548]|uniref:hypothetical protein n=1 Tax=Actinoplanes sp. NPDC049548 TaxID=3155152 RepID=UPI00341CC50D
MRTPALALATLTTTALLTSAASTPATAHGDTTRHDVVATAHLGQLNRSGAHGVATVRVHGTKAEVTVVVSGLLRNAPHAMHFHAGAQGSCPAGRADTDHDGFVSVTEGHPFYGHIVTSLTTRGDTSPASGLAIDRFSTAPHGSVVYRRTVTVSAHTAAAIAHHNAVLVVHGVDRNGSGAYDGSVKSDLDPNLPMEATAPAACGPLRPY